MTGKNFSFDDVEDVQPCAISEKVVEERKDQSQESQTGKFIISIIAMMLIDLAVFCAYKTWSAPFCITIIQVVLIIALADRWNQRSISALLKSVVNNISYSQHKG